MPGEKRSRLHLSLVQPGSASVSETDRRTDSGTGGRDRQTDRHRTGGRVRNSLGFVLGYNTLGSGLTEFHPGFPKTGP